eukprot:CAMPEP_0171297410 /NCGR_PEP_ID=MMETSP0816-20121228/6155_1 /TAXON_ID=420281 /ORGANISM="Proboscia inermis, Strain CCAP1064/1" /LENGTH=135 /DNA_ID=CAMNT_0011771665 /DNA_START=814 /DNA_END=1221 /DNA_ORIENTATION=+
MVTAKKTSAASSPHISAASKYASGVTILLSNWSKFGLFERSTYHFNLIRGCTLVRPDEDLEERSASLEDEVNNGVNEKQPEEKKGKVKKGRIVNSISGKLEIWWHHFLHGTQSPIATSTCRILLPLLLLLRFNQA